MQSWKHEINAVLLINYKGQEVIARVADYVDSLDNTKPIICNLRIADGQMWGRRLVKVEASHIIRPLPNWYAERQAAFDASIKEAADRAYARMTPEQKEKLHADMERRRRRSPLDILIDRACGIE